VNRELSKYDINIYGLEEKNHEYTFDGDDSFFGEFEQDIVEGGNFSVDVILEKTSSFIRLTLDLKSKLRLLCDRSLEVFEEDFNSQEKHIFKFGSTSEEISDEIEVIPYGTPKINIAQLLFEYILLQVPVKKLHPRFRDNEGEEGTMVYTDPNFEQEEKEEKLDPRWAALINLKNKK
jgi:uncharacterized protein